MNERHTGDISKLSPVTPHAAIELCTQMSVPRLSSPRLRRKLLRKLRMLCRLNKRNNMVSLTQLVPVDYTVVAEAR